MATKSPNAQETFDSLRRQFIEKTGSRLARMEELVDLLRREDDFEALERLYRDFHALTGLGGTYGMPRLGELAEAGEATAKKCLETSAIPSSEKERWEDLISKLRSCLPAG